MKKSLIPITVGIVTVSTSIGMELVFGEGIYMVVIAIGSVLVTTGEIILAKSMRGG
jgi:hypothetical protein